VGNQAKYQELRDLVFSDFESDVLKDALDRESIEYIAREHKDTVYDGIFILQKGYVTFFVREKDEAGAQAVIRQPLDKEVASFGGSVKGCVPAPVEEALNIRFGE
jgi:hypothetical protein